MRGDFTGVYAMARFLPLHLKVMTMLCIGSYRLINQVLAPEERSEVEKLIVSYLTGRNLAAHLPCAQPDSAGHEQY